LAKDEGYIVIDSTALYTALLPLLKCHFLIEHYADYIKNEYVDQQKYITTLLVRNNKFKHINILGKDKGQEQQYVLSKLHERLDNVGTFKYLNYSYSANRGGAPWVQLSIARNEKAYGDIAESIFWRIDKRNGETYLRLTQYANISKLYKKAKHERRDLLREKIGTLTELDQFKCSKVQNKGLKSSEILIMFFYNNDLSNLFSNLPELSRKVEYLYYSM
jgi:hypothetical protein